MKLEKKYMYPLIIAIIVYVLLSLKTYAKYTYKFELNSYELIRDNSEIKYQLEISDYEKKYINKDVLLKIIFNKEIEPIDNFIISEDRKCLSKIVTENENRNIKVNDLSGNSIMIHYDIKNIDKIPPEIIGIENGKKYKEIRNIEYRDNIGIRSIILKKYDDKSKQYKSESISENNIKNIIEEGLYKIEAIDFAGNRKEIEFRIEQ